MSRYVGTYVSTCDACLRTKPIRTGPTGHLEPLPIPERRWETISADFVTELPSSSGYDSILVVVDHLSKRAHMVPTLSTITAIGTAKLYRDHVWKLHGLPTKVISDRGPQFAADFTTELYKMIGVTPSRSTPYHPQTDGQTERVNQEMEQYLRLFVSERQDDWSELLSQAEFAYNNHVHSATQQTPFMIDTGQHPRMGFEPRVSTKNESAKEFSDRMRQATEEARSALAKAKDEMARYYNQRRSPAPEFKAGDKVYLDAADISTTRPSKKLSHRRLGPFKVEAKVGRYAYRLKFPKSMSRLHPVQNVTKLTLAPVDPIVGRKTTNPPPPELIEGDEHYIVQQILDSRRFRNRLQYKVRWEGYDESEDSWLYAEDVFSPDLVAEFHQLHPQAPRVIRVTQTDWNDPQPKRILAHRTTEQGHFYLVEWKNLDSSSNSWERSDSSVFTRSHTHADTDTTEHIYEVTRPTSQPRSVRIQ